MQKTITEINAIGSDCLKCLFSDGTAFYLRMAYLQITSSEKLAANQELTDEEFEDCMQAGLIYAAERDAVKYLERSEHSRYLLKTKLLKKGHALPSIETALDFCEEKNWLSDERFAGAWLRSRAITHIEGRNRLFAELMTRGINRNTAQKALDEFFETESEEEKLQRAIEKLTARKETDDALVRALIRKGFSEKKIRAVLK